MAQAKMKQKKSWKEQFLGEETRIIKRNYNNKLKI